MVKEIETFTPAAMARIAAAVRKVEGMSGEEPDVPILPYDQQIRVKITGPIASGRYPATFAFRMTVDDTWETGEVCRVQELNGTALTINNYYIGSLGGFTSDGYALVEVISGGGGAATTDPGSTAYCTFASLRSTDCLRATNTNPASSVGLTYDTGTWVSDSDIDYFDKSGPLVFSFVDGRLKLTLDGDELLNCGNGCWSGGALTGHTPTTPATAVACDNEVFTICVECVCCPVAGYHGEGWYCADIGAGVESVYLTDADVCDGVTISSGPHDTEPEDCSGLTVTCATPGATLYAHIEAPVGCVLNGHTVTLTRVITSTTIRDWSGPITVGATGTLQLGCNSAVWGVGFNCGASGTTFGMTETIISETPFILVATGTYTTGDPLDCCDADAPFTVTVTINEVP